MGVSINLGSRMVKIDIDHLPTTKVEKGGKIGGLVFMIVALLLGGIPTFFLIKSIIENKFEPQILLALIFTAIGIGLFLLGLYMVSSQKRITIARDKISYYAKSVFGVKQWKEPLSGYEGILSKTKTRTSGGESRHRYTVYILELHHQDKDKSITLYESLQEEGIRNRWEETCRKLNLPALEMDSGRIVKRTVEDLDKSVKELVKEGKVGIDFDLSKGIPKCLAVQTREDTLMVTVLKKQVNIVGAIIMLLFPSVFIYMGFFIEAGSIIFGIAGILLGILFLCGLVWDWITKPQIRISPKQVHVLRLTPWGQTKGEMVPAAEIETVKVVKEQMRESVEIVSDKQKIKVGEGLPKDALEWVRNCIMKVIST